MEFSKSDITNGSSSGTEIDLDKFLDRLSENFDQINEMMEKADKVGQMGALRQGEQSQSSQNVDRQRSENPENDESLSDPSDKGELVLQTIEDKLSEEFEDSDSVKKVEQEMIGQIRHLFRQLDDDNSVKDIKEYLDNPMARKQIKNQLLKHI